MRAVRGGDWFDRDMGEKMEKSGITYTRYADDLCFSSSADYFPSGVEPCIRGVALLHNVSFNLKRKIGSLGVLNLPGVCVVCGSIRPPIITLKKLVPSEIITGNHGKFSPGFGGYIKQFPRGGRRYAVRYIRSYINSA